MSPTKFPAGTTVNGRYEILGRLGGGGAANVYRVRDGFLGEESALKVLEPVAGQAVSWAEAQVLRELESDFLVPVFNADVWDQTDIRFIVMPIMSGGDLEHFARPHGMAQNEAIRWTVQIATGLQRLHASGFVHRDVKPGNVFLAGSDVKLGDLGMASSLDADGTAERNGTFCTLAPDLASPTARCSVSSDIYSLGATAAYLLSGRYPIDHRVGPAQQLAQLQRGDVSGVRDLAPHVSRSVASVVNKALSLDGADRHESALQFANQLASAARGKRSWVRVEHPGHIQCISADAQGLKRGVSICSEASGKNVEVRVRHASGRRLRGVDDETLAPSKLNGALRRIVDAQQKGAP